MSAAANAGFPVRSAATEGVGCDGWHRSGGGDDSSGRCSGGGGWRVSRGGISSRVFNGSVVKWMTGVGAGANQETARGQERAWDKIARIVLIPKCAEFVVDFLCVGLITDVFPAKHY